MSRTYALALIFAAVTFISGLFYGQYRYLTDGQVEVVAYAAGVHERVVAGQLAQMRRLSHQANDRMQDDTKYRFRPILPFVDNVFEQRDAYLKRVKENKENPDYDVAVFSRFHNAELDSLASVYTTFLQEHGGGMDLRLEDINTKVAHIGKIINEVRAVQNDAVFSSSKNTLVQQLLALDYLEVVSKVVHDVVEISGGKVLCGGEYYFPIMVTDIENPRKGETVTAKVWVGSYSTSLTPENVILSVGNDTLKINPDGTADYVFTPEHRGKLEFNMEMSIINPLTGMVTRGQGVRTYNIR